MRSILFLSSLALCLASPLRLNGRQSNKAKVSRAKDGSTIIEDQVQINGLNMRFKVSAPASELVNGNDNKGTGKFGINVLFHGDGGQSFSDFPNQGVQSGLMGIAMLSPDSQRRWGGVDRNGVVRPDGAAHSAAINQFLTEELPKLVNFDKSKIFLEGVSGGSLMLAGFTIPEFGASLGVQGAVLGCGGLEPQVDVKGDLSKLRVHFQSTTDDLQSLKIDIPKAIVAYEKLIPGEANGVSLVTADATIQGGHCEFDSQGFVSGIQLMTDNYARILNGESRVAVSVQGNENIFNAQQVQAAAQKNAQKKKNNQNQQQQQETPDAQNNAANNGKGNTAKESGSTSTVEKAVKTVTVDVTKTVENVVATTTVDVASTAGAKKAAATGEAKDDAKTKAEASEDDEDEEA
jgi:hypothetical protein